MARRGWVIGGGGYVALVLAATLAVSGGTPADERTGSGSSIADAMLGGAPDGSVLAAGLVTATSCEQLGATMTALRTEHGAGGWYATEDEADEEMATDDAAGAEAPAAGADGAAGRSDTTNVQVAGVDEPDLVEVLDDVVVTTTGGQLRVLQVVDDRPVLRGSLDLDGWEPGLMAVDDRHVVVLVRGGEAVRPVTDAGVRPGGWGTTTALLVDVGDPDAPVVEAELAFEGDLVDARLADGVLRLAVRSGGPQVDVGDVAAAGAIPEPDWATATREELAAWDAAVQAAWQRAHEAAWAEVRPEHWQPHVRSTVGGAARVEPLVACDRIGFPTAFSGLGTLTIAAVEVDADGMSLADAEAVVAGGETLYATRDRLVVATTRWGPVPVPEQPQVEPVEPFVDTDDAVSQVLPLVDSVMPGPWPSGDTTTDLHVFDVDAGRVAHVASGEVEGRLLNQYAMSIHDGVLRTATTSVGDDGRSQSSVVTHRVEGAELVEVGRVDGLGPDEDIQSVRYLGDVAYVVTFRRTDPLYVVDLADPASPRVLGELKIEGYSAHLQFVRPGVLLGVGQDADPATGFERGTQVSTFDVTDPSAPSRIDVDVLADSSSEVQWDPKALLVTGDGLVVTPVEQWGEDGGRLGALVHRVDVDGGLDRLGRLDVGTFWELRPRRTVDLGSVLLTVGDAGAVTWDRDTLRPVDRVVADGRAGTTEPFPGGVDDEGRG